MKKLFALSIMIFAIMVIAACGTRAQPDFEMMWFGDGIETESMEALLQSYRDETGVYIELYEIGWDVYETRLGTVIDGGEAPALVRTTEGVMNNFKDHMVDLTDVFDEAGFTNIFYNDEGKPLGLPMDVTANGLYVNFDLLDKYDVNYPVLGDTAIWDWDEFETEMDKLRDKADVTYPGVFDFQGHRFFPLIYQHNGVIWDEPFTSTNLTEPGAVAAVELLMHYYRSGMLSPEVFVSGGAAPEAFETGSYGFHMSGNWNASRYADLDFSWGVVPMPTGPDGTRATILGGKAMSAVSGSGHEQEAKDFIEWLSQPTKHDAYNSYVPFLSARIGADIDFGDLAHVYDVFQDEINATPPIFVNDWLSQVMIPGMYPMINLVTQRAVADEMTALQILEALEASLIAAMED